MLFIDTHNHISDEAFEGCEDEILERAANSGVALMLQADVDSKERPAMFEACRRHPDRLYPMIGLYPGSVDLSWEEELEKMVSYRAAYNADGRGPKIVAMGEIGLDYHFSTEFKKEQKEAFREQLELAAQWNLPVNIHLRDATDDFFEIIEEKKHLGLKGNLHAFSGSYETFCRLSKYGEWKVGIGGVLTFKKASIARDIVKIPMENILLETDAPYLAPTPHRGERNESSFIPIIAAKIAELKGTSLEEVAGITTQNAKQQFGI